MVAEPRISIPCEPPAPSCARYGVREVSVFGSVLRDDFGSDSDVDVLLEFMPGRWFTFENTPDILGRIFGRRVYVVEKGRLRGDFRRRAILDSRRVVYAA